MHKLRMADILGNLSVICDLGFGLPPQNSLRASLVAAGLARSAGVDEEDASASFYVALLTHIGCISMSHETAALFGDEIAVTGAVAMTNLGDPRDIVDTLIPKIATIAVKNKLQASTESLIEQSAQFASLYDTASAEVARQAANRMGLPESVQRGLSEQSEAWNGEGAPQGLEGEGIALSSRIARIAGDAAFFHHVGGVDLAVDAIRARSGTLHDPDLSDLFARHAVDILAGAGVGEPQQHLLDAEPEPVLELEPIRMSDVTAAFGDAADLKMPFTHGHSAATAEVAVAAGKLAGWPEEEIADLKMGAHLHDIGRVAISNSIWEKRGPLTTADWEEVRMHTYHGERIVARSSRLTHLAPMVGMHHERPDGSGYHRGAQAKAIPAAARIVGVADAWVSMQQARPHRPPLDPDQAAEELQKDAEAGKLDPEAVRLVLEVAGRGDGQGRSTPAGLSRREIEVLRLIAEGCSNPDIAERLHISRRTAEHHVQHIYTKIGVSTRPGAAMFALEHDLLERLGV